MTGAGTVAVAVAAMILAPIAPLSVLLIAVGLRLARTAVTAATQ